ncbi:TIMELESS-interacting protein [Synchiropus splendidus]|uniref:TIMELESS-interacting protein n=1 Tax=Synchiropus splendidus TaxID=270530 RepID=UPI00237EE69D|nr:TIMELESS-interacting protein [Synchiropus splendidus]
MVGELMDHDAVEDEAFPPLPPPTSPGNEEEGEVSQLADVPEAKRKSVKRPQPKLDSNRLTSGRGLPALRTLFEDTPFRGRGHEQEDLRVLMSRMENWAHRLFPKLQFEDFIDRVERLGSKKDVQTCLKRIRLDMPLIHEDFGGEEGGEEQVEPETVMDSDPFSVFPANVQWAVSSTPAPQPAPVVSPDPPSLTEEQQHRMEMNRMKALERRLTRQKAAAADPPTVDPMVKEEAETINDSTSLMEEEITPSVDPSPAENPPTSGEEPAWMDPTSPEKITASMEEPPSMEPTCSTVDPSQADIEEPSSVDAKPPLSIEDTPPTESSPVLDPSNMRE